MVGGVERIIVQCKRQPKVGVEAARELLGVVASSKQVTKGYLVATGEFSEPCRRFLKEHGNLSGISGAELAKLVHQYNIPIPSDKTP